MPFRLMQQHIIHFSILFSTLLQQYQGEGVVKAFVVLIPSIIIHHPVKHHQEHHLQLFSPSWCRFIRSTSNNQQWQGKQQQRQRQLLIQCRDSSKVTEQGTTVSLNHDDNFVEGDARKDAMKATSLLWSASSNSNNVNSTGMLPMDWKAITGTFLNEMKEIWICCSIAMEPFVRSDSSVTVQEIIEICDQINQLGKNNNNDEYNSRSMLSSQFNLRGNVLEFTRYELLAKLMRKDYEAYVATASFLSPSRIPRGQLPNVQDIPFDKKTRIGSSTIVTNSNDSVAVVADCELDDMVYNDSILDKVLLSIFRKLVQANTNGISSPKEGILGLVEQGRTFMLQPTTTPEAQHMMVYNTLGSLMTPILPPFYRIFMSGIVPRNIGGGGGGDNDDERGTKQLGPWFYAPWLTSVVTPTFFAFLVGPSHPNRRRDGQWGGLLVEKCKFLQESNCKGLCLHQCKLPAQQFFQEQLGLALTVSPNFETQECQWSFGENPLLPSEDPSFPKGCLVGCESRMNISTTTSRGTDGWVNLCN